MHKFKEIEEIIKTMEYYNYKYINDSDSTRDKLLRRQKGEEFSLQDHLRALVFAELSNQRPWEQIENNKQKIIEIFHYFDVDYLKNVNPEELIKAIKEIHCGNRQINKQMLTLKDNVLTLETIEKENGSIDKYYNSITKYELIKSLSCGKYKLKQMGMPLVSEYLKSMGIDIIKPDVHVCRILGRLGYTEHNPAKIEEAYDISEQIAKEFGKTNIEIDSILWQYGAKGYFEQCGDNPKCKTCFVENCKYKKHSDKMTKDIYVYVYNLHYRELFRINQKDKIEYYNLEKDIWKDTQLTKEQVYCYDQKKGYKEIYENDIGRAIRFIKNKEKLEDLNIYHYSIEKATQENIKNIYIKNLNGLFYAECGAMGYPGLIMAISNDMDILYSDTYVNNSVVSQLEITKLFKGFEHVNGFSAPDFQWTTLNDEPWMYFNLGMGNHLYLREDLYKKIGNQVFDVNQGQRYRKWFNLTGFDDYIKLKI